MANVPRKSPTCYRTCFEDATRMLRGSYEETAAVEFSLKAHYWTHKTGTLHSVSHLARVGPNHDYGQHAHTLTKFGRACGF